MNKFLIKLKYGFTIDENNQCESPCPKCGSVVCHVKGTSNKVFCTNTFCDFQDEYNANYYNQVNNRLDYMSQYGAVFFYDNYKYHCSTIPFITEEDLKAGRYFVREFKLDAVMWYNHVRDRGGSWESCYEKDCRIIARYYSKDLMAKDGWVVNKDPSMP